MHTTAITITLVACLGIIAIGARFLMAPRAAMLGFGVAPDGPGAPRALTAIKGVRDITSGVVLLVVWVAGGHTVLGWALIAAALTPVADAVIVRANDGELATALGVHALTAVLLLAAGLVLVL